MSDESPTPKCACLRFVTARECLRERYPPPEFGPGGYDDEECECACHYTAEVDDGWEEDEADYV